LVQDQYKGGIELFGAEYQNAIWISANSEDMEKVVATILHFDSKAKDNIQTKTKNSVLIRI
ncbi:MAG: hypothetical protein U9R54_03080, partial [Bacteroidota bacterium]|nr:hypothetical protein [Bacteroidota bacterium]